MIKNLKTGLETIKKLFKKNENNVKSSTRKKNYAKDIVLCVGLSGTVFTSCFALSSCGKKIDKNNQELANASLSDSADMDVATSETTSLQDAISKVRPVTKEEYEQSITTTVTTKAEETMPATTKETLKPTTVENDKKDTKDTKDKKESNINKYGLNLDLSKNEKDNNKTVENSSNEKTEDVVTSSSSNVSSSNNFSSNVTSSNSNSSTNTVVTQGNSNVTNNNSEIGYLSPEDEKLINQPPVYFDEEDINSNTESNGTWNGPYFEDATSNENTSESTWSGIYFDEEYEDTTETFVVNGFHYDSQEAANNALKEETVTDSEFEYEDNNYNKYVAEDGTVYFYNFGDSTAELSHLYESNINSVTNESSNETTNEVVNEETTTVDVTPSEEFITSEENDSEIINTKKLFDVPEGYGPFSDQTFRTEEEFRAVWESYLMFGELEETTKTR